MGEFVRIGVEGGAGIITLDRPKAINALNLDMVDEILDALALWADQDRIKIVLIEGAGEKGLCAGGDVRLARELMLAGERDRVVEFFANEYRMNGMIAGYEKPIIALQHGIVMGGGIGISSHARYRIATTGSRFAMPEAAIGFFSDVGVNAILYQTPQAQALAFLLSGESIGAADAIALGLADVAVDPREVKSIRHRLIEAARASEPDTAISAILGGESVNTGPAGFYALADSLSEAFVHERVGDIVAHLSQIGEDGDPGAAVMAAAMARHCPTSLEAIAMSHRKARRLRDVTKVLEVDLRLARFLTARSDFDQGVRAVLVDKDRNPRWDPAGFDDVDIDELEQVIG